MCTRVCVTLQWYELLTTKPLRCSMFWLKKAWLWKFWKVDLKAVIPTVVQSLCKNLLMSSWIIIFGFATSHYTPQCSNVLVINSKQFSLGYTPMTAICILSTHVLGIYNSFTLFYLGHIKFISSCWFVILNAVGSYLFACYDKKLICCKFNYRWIMPAHKTTFTNKLYK